MRIAFLSVALMSLSLSPSSYLTAYETGTDLSLLREEFAALQSAKGDHAVARHAYLLNQEADAIAALLNHNQSPGSGAATIVQQANRYGASIIRCVYSGTWTVPGDGYRRYLTLWPKGPKAEEAWWRGRLHHTANSCYDAVGTEEEAAGFVQDYRDFLKHFPSGQHQNEAREALRRWKADLVSYQDSH